MNDTCVSDRKREKGQRENIRDWWW